MRTPLTPEFRISWPCLVLSYLHHPSSISPTALIPLCVILYLPHPPPLTLLSLTVMEVTLDVPAIKLMLVALLCRRILHQLIVLEREEAKINEKPVTKRHRDPN